MRLRNKKTGDIGNFKDAGDSLLVIVKGEAVKYETVGDLSKEWETFSESDNKSFEEVATAAYEVDIEKLFLKESHAENVRRGAGCLAPQKIRIADCDYYEILPDGTKKTEFTWEEAMQIPEKTHGKWRLPTEQEWFAICAAFGKDKNGEIAGKALAENLNLTTDEDGYGYYWSSTPYAATYAHDLSFYSTYVSPQDCSNKTCGFTIRCVAW